MTSTTRRYFCFYAAFFGFLASCVGFFPLYFRSLGFTAFEISLLSAAASLAPITAPPVLAHIAHFWHSPRIVVLCASLLAIVSYLTLFTLSNFAPVFAAWFLCLWFYWGFIPLVETVILKQDLAGQTRFGHARIGGSLGFILSMTLLGELVSRYSTSIVLPVGAILLALLMLAIIAIRKQLRDRALQETLEVAHSLREYILSSHSRPLLLFLLVYALVWASSGAYYTYFSLHLESLGFSPRYISVAWTIGVVAEVLLFSVFFRIEKRFSLYSILTFSVVMTVLRWGILATSTSTMVILLSQVLHAFSFGACHNAGVKIVHSSLPEGLRDRGQAILTSLGGGVGGFSGRLIAGVIAERSLNYHKVFLGSALIAGLALIPAIVLHSRRTREQQ